MYYPEEVIEEVRMRSDIVDVISRVCEASEERGQLFWPLSLPSRKITVIFRGAPEADVSLLWMRRERQCDYLCYGI